MSGPFDWKPGEHGVAIGQTGSGKTWGMKNGAIPYWMSTVGRVGIIDVEEGRDFSEPIFKPRSLGTLLKWSAGDKPFLARVQANVEDAEMFLNELSDGLLSQGHDMYLYLDESSYWTPHGNAYPKYDALQARARKRNISVISATQRPQLASKTVYTQSIHRIWYYVDQYDVENWLSRSAKPVFDHMPEVPYGSYSFLQQHPDSTITRHAPVPKYDWDAWTK